MNELANSLKISLNYNMYTHTSLTVSSTIMPGCVDASKNNLASVILQSTKTIKIYNFWNVWSIFSLC